MWLEIGRIVGVQGLKGEVRVYPNSDFPERFLEPGKRWLLRPGASEPEPIDLLSGRYLTGKGLYIIQLAGVNDRTQAETLRDCCLLVPESDRPPLEEDEFHVLDLIGLEVFDQATQKLVGTVVDVIPAGNDLLEVKLNDSQRAVSAFEETESQSATNPRKPSRSKGSKAPTVLIPFVKAIVPIVNLEQKRLEITPPQGLLER